MDEEKFLAGRFEAQRAHLRSVAYRMLGSLSEADDAVQEAWLRASRADTQEVENLGGWLTTIVARVALDMLRSRKARPDAPMAQLPDAAEVAIDPESESLLADSVGLALLVVLETLAPAERLAFVLHDMFALPFEEIAGIVGRTPTATRQLASRARRRVQGAPTVSGAELATQRKVVAAFLAALRSADFEGLLAVLDPDVHVRGDTSASGGPLEIRGAHAWAKGAIAFARSVGASQAALVEGSVGLVLAPRGHLLRAIVFTFVGDRIATVDIVARPERLRSLDLAVLEPG